MTKHKYLGIYMDHSKAHLIEILPGGVDTTTIESSFTHELKEEDVRESEHHMHNAERHMHATYYKKLGEVIKTCGQVLLFGPTTAKEELHNLIKTDHQFAGVKIDVKHCDKLTENQQHAFVKEYFAIKNV